MHMRAQAPVVVVCQLAELVSLVEGSANVSWHQFEMQVVEEL